MVKKKQYFNEETEKAVVAYQNEKSKTKRNKIWTNDLTPALTALVHGVRSRYPYTIGDKTEAEIADDMMFRVYELMSKFDPSRGFLAYSYFSKCLHIWICAEAKRFAQKSFKTEEISSSLQMPETSNASLALVVQLMDDWFEPGSLEDRVISELQILDIAGFFNEDRTTTAITRELARRLKVRPKHITASLNTIKLDLQKHF